jgi:hypothetical protein
MIFECEYICKAEFENNLGYESGIHMGSILEINKRPKNLMHCPFKDIDCNKMGRLSARCDDAPVILLTLLIPII